MISTTKVRELARIAVKTSHLGWRVVFDGVALPEFEQNQAPKPRNPVIRPKISQMKCFSDQPKNWAVINTTKVRGFDQLEATPSQKLWRVVFVRVGVCP